MTSFLEYAPAPESTAILDLKPSYGLFIGGEFVDGHGAGFTTISPSTEKHIADIASADAQDVDLAVAAARRAYERTWSKLSGADRGKYLFRIARLVQERARELAVAESLDNGKPIKEARDVDVPLVAAWFFYYAGWADKLDYAGLGANPRSLGVAAQVVPWNFPLLMLAWKIAPALAAGNTVVIKPAETTPLTALIFAEILQQADLPAGVVNIITGAGETGELLVNHPGVDKVAFTGSTAVGKAIARSTAGSGKKVTLELGGKAANIVFDDAPIDQATEGMVPGSSSTRAMSAALAVACSCRRTSTTKWSPGSRRGCRPCGSATRSIRTPISVRSTHARSSTASGNYRPSESPRERSAGRPSVPFPKTGSGSPRRSSPTSRPATGSPGTRSSARFCPC